MAPSPPPSSPRGATPDSATGDWRRSLPSLLAWVLVALLLRWLIVEPRWIPSGSMLPTLQLKDRVLVEKVGQRLHRPLSPGTIVVFHPPQALQAAGYDRDAALIKRVVGVAGDTLEVQGGRLLRNGSVSEQDWAREPMDYAFGPVTVPAHHLLVLGDNRNASLDSHLWGPLPESEVIGTAIWRYWPLQRFGPIRFSAAAATGAP